MKKGLRWLTGVYIGVGLAVTYLFLATVMGEILEIVKTARNILEMFAY